jgi:hypothetical protein
MRSKVCTEGGRGERERGRGRGRGTLDTLNSSYLKSFVQSCVCRENINTFRYISLLRKMHAQVIFLVLAAVAAIASGFRYTSVKIQPFATATGVSISSSHAPRHASRLQAAAGPEPMDEETREKLDKLVQSNKVLLFMKGNPLFPQWLVRGHRVYKHIRYARLLHANIL